MENNARLLILSGNNICFTFMASKAVNGRAVELARFTVFLALVSTTEQSIVRPFISTPRFAFSDLKAVSPSTPTNQE